MMRSIRVAGAALLMAGTALTAPAWALTMQVGAPAPAGYQQPPQPIADILDAKLTPASMLSPDRRTLVLMDRSNLPSIQALSEPMLRLAGYRINPRNNGPAESRIAWLTAGRVTPMRSAAARKLPASATARNTETRFRSVVIG